MDFIFIIIMSSIYFLLILIYIHKFIFFSHSLLILDCVFVSRLNIESIRIEDGGMILNANGSLSDDIGINFVGRACLMFIHIEFKSLVTNLNSIHLLPNQAIQIPNVLIHFSPKK